MSSENKQFARQFGHEVYQARIHYNLTQRDVATLVGITLRWYQKIEAGTVMPGLQIGCRLLVMLGLDASTLLGRPQR